MNEGRGQVAVYQQIGKENTREKVLANRLDID